MISNYVYSLHFMITQSISNLFELELLEDFHIRMDTLLWLYQLCNG